MDAALVTDAAAASALKAGLANLNHKDRGFAESLLLQADKRPLSDKQWYWVRELAKRASGTAPVVATVSVGATMAGVIALFAKTAGKLKNPAIVLAANDGAVVRLSLAKPNSNNPGFVYLRRDDAYCGKISPTGDFTPFRLDGEAKLAVVALLAELAADPAGTAAAYGKLTGNCCFCSRALKDERSTEVGYGPICAGHYDLPWGE